MKQTCEISIVKKEFYHNLLKQYENIPKPTLQVQKTEPKTSKTIVCKVRFFLIKMFFVYTNATI